MPNSGDFDPAKAIQGVRQQRAAEEAKKRAAEVAEKQRIQTERDNIRELLRHADKQLENIRNPIVSEFVVTERWTTEPKTISKWEKRADQVIISTGLGFFGNKISVATQHQRQTRYYGSWLSLYTFFRESESEWGTTMYRSHLRRGLVKLRQPRLGYAYVNIENDWDPRNVGNFDANELGQHFRIFASLEEMIEDIRVGQTIGSIYLGPSVESVTKTVQQALDFVATGQPPDPESY